MNIPKKPESYDIAEIQIIQKEDSNGNDIIQAHVVSSENDLFLITFSLFKKGTFYFLLLLSSIHQDTGVPLPLIPEFINAILDQIYLKLDSDSLNF